jgi:hypothetical protein
VATEFFRKQTKWFWSITEIFLVAGSMVEIKPMLIE